VPFDAPSPEFTLTARRLRMGIARTLEDLNVLMKRPGLIRFTAGVPDAAIADPQILELCTHEALTRGQHAWQGYGDPQGLLELRTRIAERYQRKGVPISPQEILITNGSQQGIAIMA
jgi:2-aminoadipate transaminase